jgi:type II secretory pathway component PulC
MGPLLLAMALSQPPTDIVVVGVVVSPDPVHSTVILQMGSRSHVASPGETAFGGVVRDITTQGASLEFDGRVVQLRVRKPTEVLVKAAPAPPAPADPGAERTMARKDLERRLGTEMSRIMSETAVSSVANGGVKGVALNRVPQGTLLTDAGLQQGDIITEVDGVSIDSPITLLSLYPKLQTESQFQAVVLRNGMPVTLTLSLH